MIAFAVPGPVTELFSDRSRWAKGSLARNAAGKSLSGYAVAPPDNPLQSYVDHPDAVAWCLRGAMMKCYSGLELSMKTADVVLALRQRGYTGIAAFNDDRNTKWEDVLSLVKELSL
jgi:hypothetical protein